MSTPVLVVNETTKRSTGRDAQRSNIDAAHAVSQVVRTTLGPRSMLKMILDPMGGIVLTNDGNAILREIRYGSTARSARIEPCRPRFVLKAAFSLVCSSAPPPVFFSSFFLLFPSFLLSFSFVVYQRGAPRVQVDH